MNDSQKTIEQLSQELAELRKQLAQQEVAARERVAGLLQRTGELEERAKELECLHGISRLLGKPDLPLDELLQSVVELLPPAWQYPEVCAARLLIGDQDYRTARYVETPWQQIQEIASDGQVLGQIEVGYLEERPEHEDGPFLDMERVLLESIADLVGGTVQQHRDREALRRSEATARGLLDAVTDQAMLLDREGVVLHVNEAMAKTFGRSPDQLVGVAVRELISIDVAESERGVFWDVVHGGQPIRFEYERNGVWSEIGFFPILDAEGRAGIVALLAWDISHLKEVQGVLRESERAYRTLFEQALVGILHSEADDTLVAVNPAAVRILGYETAEALIGQPAEVIWFDVSERAEAIQEAEARGFLPTRKVTLRCKDGQPIPCLVTAAMLREDDGRFGGFVATFTDITEQRRAEEALRQSHADLEQCVEQRTVALVEINAYLQNEIRQRRRVEQVLQQTNRHLNMLIESGQAVIRAKDEEALLGEVCRIAVDRGGYRLIWIGYAEQDEYRTVRPVAQAGLDEGYLETLDITWADGDRGRDPIGTAIRTGQPCLVRDIQRDPKFAPWRAEAIKRGYASSLALPLNAEFGCLGSLNIYAAETGAFDREEVTLLQELAGDLTFGILTLRSQSDRQRSEQALWDRVRELDSLQRLSRRASASVSPDQMVRTILEEVTSIVATDATLLRLREGEDLMAKRVYSADGAYVERGDSVERVGECLCGQAVRDGQPIYVRDIHSDLRCTGEQCKLAGVRSFAALPLRSGDSVFGVLGLASAAEVDFGEQASFLETIADQVAVALENARLSRKAAELEVMREVDRQRSKLLADVSHELRTPLGLIKILASTLLREDVVFERETHVEFLQDIDDEADKLMQIVDNLLGLRRAERGRLRLAKQPVDLVSIVDGAVGSLQTQFLQHRFVQDLPDPPVVVDADTGRLEQVMRNLLENAAKYAPAGSTIKVVGQVVEGEVLVRVIDQGIGIAKENLGRIFERFYRVDNEITRRTRGVGLGLSLCQEIVKENGGSIWAESVPGVGSSFTFSLPLVSDMEQ